MSATSDSSSRAASRASADLDSGRTAGSDRRAMSEESLADGLAEVVGDAAIELNEAVCLIGKFPALAGITLRVREGEVVLLRGPNGAGKSTLLRLCAGLTSLAAGSGSVLNHDLGQKTGRRAVRREVGLLSHATALYDELTVEQNIRFWVEANRSDPKMIEPVMDRFGLSGRLRSVGVSGLSAGQRRRTALAIVVCRRPRLWLLDEPHSGLDEEGRIVIDELVVQAAASGATVIVASHEVERVAELAGRTIYVAGGRVQNGAVPSEAAVSSEAAVPSEAACPTEVAGPRGEHDHAS